MHLGKRFVVIPGTLNPKHTQAAMHRRKRVIVHIPSISREEAQRMSIHDFALRQNAQVSLNPKP